MMNIRPETPHDINKITELNNLVFNNPTEGQIVNNLRNNNQLFLSLVIEQNNKIIGHIAYSPMGLKNKESKLNLLGLGPMAIHPDYQQQGLGKKLVLASLEMLKNRNTNAIFVLGHPDYYPKFGFIPAKSNFNIYSIYPVDDTVFMALELIPKSLEKLSGEIHYANGFTTD